ncbi:hypothetical protein K505DRAFT_331486 [Melanomma pulvis-pyrius CBS 109.77]|uniref:Uncharacterized protein n=1 Tax=Melanomma pulvis-pyrius CBS 109.77 TaxID=1314802 RepID=A0A6A6XXM2_9PLEO|nr:hypothetical protein K505DRAFT_331486 [Melanomma pulvis-pyrius CBS 109.77]
MPPRALKKPGKPRVLKDPLDVWSTPPIDIAPEIVGRPIKRMIDGVAESSTKKIRNLVDDIEAEQDAWAKEKSDMQKKMDSLQPILDKIDALEKEKAALQAEKMVAIDKFQQLETENAVLQKELDDLRKSKNDLCKWWYENSLEVNRLEGSLESKIKENENLKKKLSSYHKIEEIVKNVQTTANNEDS